MITQHNCSRCGALGISYTVPTEGQLGGEGICEGCFRADCDSLQPFLDVIAAMCVGSSREQQARLLRYAVRSVK